MQTHIGYEKRQDVGYVTFRCDEPGKPTTLDLLVLDELADRLDEIEADLTDLRAVIVQSDSTRYFVVGANVNALHTLSAETIVPWIEKGHKVFDRLEALSLPTIALVRGYALGGGLELAMACDLIVASVPSRFGQPEAALGFVAGWGGTYRLPRRVGAAKAKELLFTGRTIDAQTALGIGLINFVGEEEQVTDYVAALLEDLRKGSPIAIAQMKTLVRRSEELDPHSSCLEEAMASLVCMTQGDTRARIEAFLASRKSRGQGSTEGRPC